MLLAGTAGAARADAATSCDEAGRAAEQSFGLPAGLLHAIGRVESGRWDVARGRTVPWPWAVDVAGQGQLFDSETAALRATRDALDAGQHNVDVGCFQINLLHHPFAFTDLTQAFDPRANADAAARFLTELHARLGTWPEAVAAYHSADPQLGEPYRRRVLADWPEGAGAAAPAPKGFIVVEGVRIWTPVAPGSAPGSIVLGPATQHLPRVITPGG